MSAVAAAFKSPSTDASFTIASLSSVRREHWNSYVVNHPQGSLFHQTGWLDAVEQTYGHKNVSLAAQAEDGALLGVLPLCDVRSFLLGDAFISSAFSVGGGVLADRPDVAEALIAEAHKSASDKHGYIELRGGAPVSGCVIKDTVYAGFEKTIPMSQQACLAAIPRKKRADLRKAMKAESEGELTYHPDASLETVYKLYARSVRDLGTPVFPVKWLTNLARHLGGRQISFSMISRHGKPIAGLACLWEEGRAMPYYGGALPEARSLHAYDLLYWKIMEQAIDRGISRFDFGRSKVGSGPYAYKKYWGFEPSPLVYRYRLLQRDVMPDVNPNNPKFSLATKLWKKLPLPAAQLLGPPLARHLA